jgi:glucose/arabinose dehydrogenase
MKTLERSAVRMTAIGIATLAATACGHAARIPFAEGVGPSPVLPPPETSLIPMEKIAQARGWRAEEAPTAAGGLAVTAFARGLDHPRSLYTLPNGDVLVAETNAPRRPDDAKGIEGWFFKLFQKKAGAGVPSANRITLLRDTDGDGVADVRSVFLDSVTSPFGMVLIGDALYVANTDALVRVPYVTGQMRAGARPTKLVDLPAGTINHHWTKSLVASPDGRRLYVGVGSNSNAAENGLDAEAERAAVWEVDPATGVHRVYASGLRNPTALAWEPEHGVPWVAVNERDELGSDLVPDYITALHAGGFYGWPFSYFGQHVDKRVKPQRPDLVAAAIVPDYALGTHVSPLGLVYSPSRSGTAMPVSFEHGMFIGQHGSWNRKPRSGYRVVFVPFVAGAPAGTPIEVLTGFLDVHGRARGRPVGVALDTSGALLVADDVGNTIWRVTATQKP